MKYLNSKALLVAIAAVTTIFISSCGNHCDFGPEDWTHFVKRDTAHKWVRNYLDRYGGDTAQRKMDIKLRKFCSNLFSLGRGDDFKNGKWMMGNMMCRDSVIGFRIYYGLKTPQNDTIIPILVGITASYNDVYWNKPAASSTVITTAKFQGGGGTEEGVMDISQKIPPPMQIGSRNLFDQ